VELLELGSGFVTLIRGPISFPAHLDGQ